LFESFRNVSFLIIQPYRTGWYENHRGGKQLSPKPKEIHFLPFLDDGQLGGGNVQSINVRGQAGESLLGAVGAVIS